MLTWVIALGGMVLAVTALQVAAYYYLIHDDGAATPVDSEAAVGSASPGETRARNADRPSGGDADDRPATRRCTECGAPNASESIYTFCRNCGAEL